MQLSIAIAGKGGVGKTTVAGLVVLRLAARRCRPVLAVDADPNRCLDGVLGVRVTKSIGAVREQAREIAGQGLTAGMGKRELLEMRVAESLVETDDFDLIAMGRPEGPGCYCYANNVLREAIRLLSNSYPYIVIDNEAGLENLSRRIVRKVDLLLLVADPSRHGLATARRLRELAGEMGTEFGRLALIVNRLRRPELPDEAVSLGRAIGAAFTLGLPYEDVVADLSEQGASLQTLGGESAAVRKIDNLLDWILDRAAHRDADAGEARKSASSSTDCVGKGSYS